MLPVHPPGNTSRISPPPARRSQTTALAREMCEKLLARNLTQQDDARLLDDLLQKAGVDDGN